MVREFEKRRHDPIVQLRIGRDYSWPVFRFNLNLLASEQEKLLLFFGNIHHVTDIRTVKKTLERADKYLIANGSPVETTQYFAFKYFEEISNQMYTAFRKLPGNEEVDQLIETNTHHGFTHHRRFEKHLKEFFKKEPAFRRNPNQLFNILSQLISIRFHDVLELFSDGKVLHTEGGALLMLGFFSQNREIFNQILEKMNIDKPDDSTWSKIITSAFITCLYHSKPKLLKEVQKKITTKDNININNLLVNEFSMSNLYKTLSKLKEKHSNKPNLIKFINEGYNYLTKNKDNRIFDLNEFDKVVDLIESAKLFAAFDKLDSVFPAELSTIRTFITMKDKFRPFFEPMKNIVYDKKGAIKPEILKLSTHCPYCQRAVDRLIKKKVSFDSLETLNDEYYLRLALAEGPSSPDDFSRLLFETQRLDFPDDLPEWLKAAFKYTLIEKGTFLFDMVPKFLTSGDIEIFHQVYYLAETELLIEYLSKFGIKEEDIKSTVRSYSELTTETDKNEFISNIIKDLRQIGMEPFDISTNIKALRHEQSQLEETLAAKKEHLIKAKLTGRDTARRTVALINIATRKRQLPKANAGIFSREYLRSYYSASKTRLSII
jgi:glutaredoxin